jgi:WD40 repeat protein
MLVTALRTGCPFVHQHHITMAGMLAIGLLDGQLMLVDAACMEVKWSVKAHSGAVSESKLADIARSGWCIWDNCPGRIEVAMSPDGSLVASVGNEHHWKLWDTSSGTLHRVGATHDGTGACICDAGGAGRMPGSDAHIRLVVQEGCPVVAHTSFISVVVFSSCGQMLATAGARVVILWDAHTWEAAHRMTGHSNYWVNCLSFSADGARLASGWDGCRDGVNDDEDDRVSTGEIRVWDTATGALLYIFPDFLGGVSGVSFPNTINSILVFVGPEQSGGGNIDSGETQFSEEGELMVFSRDGRTVAVTEVQQKFTPGSVNLVNRETSQVMFRIPRVGPVSVTFSVDGSMLAIGSFQFSTCKVWDLSTGALLRTIEVGTPVCSVAWGRDWVRDTQRGVAFAMGHHPRLGAGSLVLELDEGVLGMILSRAKLAML